MKYLNRILWVAIPLLMTSCLFPDDESIEESVIEEFMNEGEAQTEQMNPDLIGTWITQSLDYTSTTTYTTDNSVSSETVTGNGIELEYAMTFTSEPNEVVGEGIYSLDLSNNQGETQISRGHNIISSAIWTYEDNTLTFMSGSKIIEATVTNLSTDTLSFTIATETTNTFNGVLTVKTTNATYEFIKQ